MICLWECGNMAVDYRPDIEPSNVRPSMGTYNSPKTFRFWCQKVLPLVYDDSLSYYELLCKVVDYLNKTMEDVNTAVEDVTNLNSAFGSLENHVNASETALLQAYTDLQNYVNNYFDNLDVQEEINNKLDEMAADGSLDGLLSAYFNTFIPDFDVIRSDYTSTYTGRTRVYYSIISAEHKPKMFMAGEIGDAIYPDYFLPENAPTIMVNASVFNTTSNVPIGVVVNDGAVIQENNIYGTDTDGRYILYMDEVGALQAVTAIDHTAQDVINDGAVWAITAWDPIVLDGVYVGGIHSTTDAQPRSVIGQNSDGDYIVLVCDGRQYNSRGMSFQDIYDFVVSIGFTPRILYNLDGGSSCALYAAGVRVNSFNNDTRRAIPNVLAFTTSRQNVPLMLTERTRNIAKYWRDEAITNYTPTIEAENIVNLSFKNAGVNGIRGIVRKSNNEQYTFSDAFKLAQDEDNQAVFLDGDVGELYQRLVEFLPSNILKIFGSAIFMLKSDGVDVITSTTDFKTYVKNGIWFVGSNNANNPTGADSFLVVFAYLSSRFQMLVNTGAILIREVNEAGTYASAWKTIYSEIENTSIAANTASGLTGTFYVTRKNGVVMINGDFTVGTPVASAQLNSTAFPIPASGTMTQLVFSNNATLRANLDLTGALKFGSNVTPSGGSLNGYARISMTYIEAE